MLRAWPELPYPNFIVACCTVYVNRSNTYTFHETQGALPSTSTELQHPSMAPCSWQIAPISEQGGSAGRIQVKA